MTTCKILVACHKPASIPLDDRFVPIHCGRKISRLSEQDLNWMVEHTVGDDTGDNISHLNTYFCELTAIYWAWKNYEELGNPDRIGLCHYRRYFLDVPENSSIVAPYYRLWSWATIRTQFEKNHSSKELNLLIKLLPEGKFKNEFQKYLNQKFGYFFNMFVMPKDMFFEYCELIFPVLFKQMALSHWEELDTYQCRMPGFLAERLTGAFLLMKKSEGGDFFETITVCTNNESQDDFNKRILLLRKYSSLPLFFYVYSRLFSMQTMLRR